jgi:hypothetical protein
MDIMAEENMNKSRICVALVVAAVLVGAQAPTAVRAATVTDDFNLTLKALVGTTGGTGSLAITINPNITSGTVSGSAVTGDVSIGGVNISLNGDTVSYVLQGSSLLLSGVFAGLAPAPGGGVDALVSLTLGSNGAYIFTDSGNASLNSAGSVSVSQTPLPTSLPLLATGFGMIAMLGWYRKRKTGSYFAA